MQIKNKFLDAIVYMTSAIVSFFRSLGMLVGITSKTQRGLFFRSLDFIFRWWPKYFWKKPSYFKGASFGGFFIKYVFYNSKSKHEK